VVRSVFAFFLLLWLKLVSHLFYRFRAEWMGGRSRRWWRPVRIITILNHTSLYEVLLVGFAPIPLVWKFAHHGVLPLAEKTAKRPGLGLFFRLLMRHVVVITRQRDRTWENVLNRVDTQALVTILPEGRMMRRDGLDSSGRPMTVRGGIADILQALSSGEMLILYSSGLHHIQVPGELLPRPFKTVSARFEFVDIPAYTAERMAEGGGPEGFKQAVIADLERRRDRYCPPRPQVAPTALEPPAQERRTGTG
jgi:hypothetical protein